MNKSTFYAGRLILQQSAALRLKAFDRYALHRIMMDLALPDRDEEIVHRGCSPSGLQWVDRGEHLAGRVIDFLTDQKIQTDIYPPDVKVLVKSLPEGFLDHPRYRFQIVVNPVKFHRDQDSSDGVRGPGRRIPLVYDEDIEAWFLRRAVVNGFRAQITSIDQKGSDAFKKDGVWVRFNRARISGLISVVDQERFQKAFFVGIGKGRAFGFGFLQLAMH